MILKNKIKSLMIMTTLLTLNITAISAANTQTYDYNGTYSGKINANGESKSSTSQTYTATSSNQNTALVQNGGTLTLKKATLIKTGSNNDGDSTNFYGVNSTVLAVGSSSKAYVSDSAIVSNSSGSNGIFSTDNATVYVNNTSIKTTIGGNARGLDATYGGTIIGNKLTISTEGEHSASIATDRGGGNISVTNSKLSTQGSGSPLLYSTGNIQVDNVTGTASGSQIAGMEGYNTILINNSTLTSTNDAISGSDPIKNGIIIYQSTSGDAETTTGSKALFQATHSTLKTSITSGSMFYLTNTSANVVLKDTTLDFDSSKVNLLQVEGNNSNNWGTAGSNGASVTFTMDSQKASGNISVDTISSADIYILNNSTYTGKTSITTNSVNTNKTDAPIIMNIDSTSTWVVTGDSTVTQLNVASGGKVVDSSGKTVTIKVNGEVVVQGTSSYTITVTNKYTNTVTTSSDNEVSTNTISRTDFDNYYSTSTTYGNNSGDVGSSIDTSNITVPEDTSSDVNSSQSDSSVITYILIGCGVVSLATIIILILYLKKN